MAKKNNLPVPYSKPRAMLGKAKKLVGKMGRLTGAGLALTAAGYIAGAPSRRYAKAPKVGESRNLRNTVLSQPNKRTYYL